MYNKVGMTPTSIALKYCRKQGYHADITERFNCYTNRRSDLFGFIDIIVIDGCQMIGVQVTSQSNVNSRLKKIKLDRTEEAKRWLGTGATIEVWGTDKEGNLSRTPILITDLIKEHEI